MGDVPISYIEGVGGTRVSEEDIVAVGKHDVSLLYSLGYEPSFDLRLTSPSDPIIQGRSIIHSHFCVCTVSIDNHAAVPIMNTP